MRGELVGRTVHWLETVIKDYMLFLQYSTKPVHAFALLLFYSICQNA